MRKSKITGTAESTRKKKPTKPYFCTECDKELDIFWLTEKSKNKKSVIENHDRCVESGKFSGKFCSKMFIAGVYNVEGVLTGKAKKMK